MSSPITRRRKRGHHEPPNANDGASPVTLQSREFIEKLVREYCENDRSAKAAKDEADRAFTDASRYEQTVAELGAKEQAAVARVQQAQAELQKIQAERQEASATAERAREYGATQTANRDRFAGQATDAKTVLESFDIPVPEDTAPAEQTGAPSAGALVTATDSFKVGADDPLTGPATPFALTPDPKINDSVDRLMHHHDTDPAGEAGVA